jgi:hypothetical protein
VLALDETGIESENCSKTVLLCSWQKNVVELHSLREGVKENKKIVNDNGLLLVAMAISCMLAK